MLLDDVLKICEGDAELATSCAALSAWDRTANVDSEGMQVWTEFWENARRIDGLYAVPFDPDDPVNTPHGIALSEPTSRLCQLTC